MSAADFASTRSAAHRSCPPGQRGLTLVEVLVVLAIIAITASVSVLAIGSDDGLRAQAEARRLEARLQLAADRSMIGSTPVAIVVEPGGYRFVEPGPGSGEWVAPAESLEENAFVLPEGMTLRSADGATVLPLDVNGSGRPFTLYLASGERGWAVAFDGMTARLERTPAATPNAVPG